MSERSPSSDVAPVGRPTVGGVLLEGESGQVAFEYVLVTAAVVVPLTIVCLYVFQVLLDMYRAIHLVLNLPWP